MSTKIVINIWMVWFNHLDFDLDNQKVVDKNSGFLYMVTNLVNGRKYIGMKLFWHKKNGKLVESDWKDYLTSSKMVKNDIDKLGIASFRFEIIELFTNKAKLKKAEADFILNNGCVLDDGWYNANWNGINIKQMKQLEVHYSRPSVIFDPKTNSLIANS